MKNLVSLLFLLLGAFGATAATTPAEPAHPGHGLVTCAGVSGVQPGRGRSFQGDIGDNGDYPFSVTIPAGYASWDGVSENAPFHGFVIFLDASFQSCVYFEIHIRVEDSDTPRLADGVTGSIPLGKVRGLQTRRTGTLSGTPMINQSTLFSAPMGQGSFADGQVLLIAPKAQQAEAARVYREFLGSLKFH